MTATRLTKQHEWDAAVRARVELQARLTAQQASNTAETTRQRAAASARRANAVRQHEGHIHHMT